MQLHYKESFLGSSQNGLVQASHSLRLANYFIDFIFFYLLVFIIARVIDIENPISLSALKDNDPDSFLQNFITLVSYGLYMFLMEAILRGRSIGKFITGTKAVNFDGSPITSKTALFRGLSRIVPLDSFSALGSSCFPWHDAWAKTYVIDLKKSIIIRGE